MKRIKHIIFWLIVVGIILLLFSNHVIATDISQQQCHDLTYIIKAIKTLI